MATTLDPRVVELIQSLRSLLPMHGWAIGGAIAMRAHGVRRHTDDVDIFVLEEFRIKALRELRVCGLEIAILFAPHHYIAFRREHGDPDIRIDVLIPVGDPEESAIEMANVRAIEGIGLPVFSPEWLAITKFYADQPGAIDDINRMLQAGVLDTDEIIRLMTLLDQADAGEMRALFDRLSRPTTRRRPPPRVR